MLQRRIAEMTRDRADALDALPEDAGLELIVRTWLAPALHPQAPGPAQRAWQVLQRQVSDPAPAMREALGQEFAAVGTHLLPRLAVHLPLLTPAELQLRHGLILAAVAGPALAAAAPGVAAPDPAAVGDQIVAFVIGGLLAPPAPAPPP